jgi:hypothetical protein
MSHPGFLAQLFAREPRKLARFPDLPLDAALAELAQPGAVASGRSNPPLPSSSASNSPLPLAPAGPIVQGGSSAPLPPTAVDTAPIDPAESMGPSLSALATQVWRTKVKMVDGATGEPREDMRRVYRHVEGALENLSQMGVTMNDWINEAYDPGLPVKVLTFQPMPGVTRDTVVEAIRPTVIWKDKILQLGEVIVGIPPNSENTPQ